jgi:hypothetical protein
MHVQWLDLRGMRRGYDTPPRENGFTAIWGPVDDEFTLTDRATIPQAAPQDFSRSVGSDHRSLLQPSDQG